MVPPVLHNPPPRRRKLRRRSLRRRSLHRRHNCQFKDNGAQRRRTIRVQRAHHRQQRSVVVHPRGGEHTFYQHEKLPRNKMCGQIPDISLRGYFDHTTKPPSAIHSGAPCTLIRRALDHKSFTHGLFTAARTVATGMFGNQYAHHVLEIVTPSGRVGTVGLHLDKGSCTTLAPFTGKAHIQYPDAMWSYWRAHRHHDTTGSYQYATSLPQNMSLHKYLQHLEEQGALIEATRATAQQMQTIHRILSQLQRTHTKTGAVYRATISPSYHPLATMTTLPSTINCHTFAETLMHSPHNVLRVMTTEEQQ